MASLSARLSAVRSGKRPMDLSLMTRLVDVMSLTPSEGEALQQLAALSHLPTQMRPYVMGVFNRDRIARGLPPLEDVVGVSPDVVPHSRGRRKKPT